MRIAAHRLLRDGITELVLTERARQSWSLPESDTLALFALDIELNAQGLEAWLDHLPE